MKWHDYARFSWINGFTADNFIVIDLLADIPTKIDLRWMTRWGLFDYWSAMAFGTMFTIHDITLKTIPKGGTSKASEMYAWYAEMLKTGKIVMDIRQFCRVLQAVGLHPYWVPWVAIAESINALTEERTLLRTGFINLYKEGVWGIDNLNSLLAGFLKMQFKVSYYSLEENDWVDATVEYPVAFLPAESKLLELRALMDRALDIYREAYRYIIGGVRSYVVTPEDAEKILGSIVKEINKSFFVETIKGIVGEEASKYLRLTLDKGYFTAWKTYAKAVVEIEARERTRYYSRYLLWSVLWGLRFGYTSVEEAEKWVKDLVKAMHEHPLVENIIRLSVDFMITRFFKEIKVRSVINLLRSRRITLQEAVEVLTKLGFTEEQAKDYINANVVWYTPGLTTYATLLEIVPEAMEMSLKAVLHFNLPQDELPYWLTYIARKPFADELTLLRTRIYNLLGEGASPEEIVEVLKNYIIKINVSEKGEVKITYGGEAQKLVSFYEANKSVFQAFGITPMEWVLYNIIGILERRLNALRRAGREKVPPPSTLLEFAEYLNISEEVIVKALKEYGVASEWIEYYVKYIKVRVIADDLKSLITEMLRGLRYSVVSKEEWENFLKTLAKFGWSKEEIEILEARADIEARIELARAYYPTPQTLATILEYVKVPPKLIEEVMKARKIPKEWVEIWLQYIKVRPIADDVRGLLTSYRTLLIYREPPDNIKNEVEKLANLINFTKTEWDILLLRATIERLARGARYALPAPLTVARMVSYVPEAAEWLSAVIKAYDIPDAVAAIIKKYATVYSVRRDVERYILRVTRLFEYAMIDGKKLEELLSEVIGYGITKQRMELIIANAKLGLAYRAYQYLIGSPRTLVTMAEYVPAARDFAINRVNQLIDCLPLDENTKKLLKKMWEDFIRIRPVYDEVRRYITELISDYANEVIDDLTLENELKELKKWGIDDYEIEFYKWLAKKRRIRYIARRSRRSY